MPGESWGARIGRGILLRPREWWSLFAMPRSVSAIQPELREKQAIYLPRSLRRRLRVWSAVLDRQISDLIAEAIGGYLERLEKERADRGLPPIPTD
jgi:hypothetical protein